ncbi:hypothetical protein C8R48DRAFT_600452, partial [Suillus tomentosus]
FLQLSPKYAMDIQALLPMALCMLHNFICCYDPIILEQDFLHGNIHDLILTNDDMGNIAAQGELSN